MEDNYTTVTQADLVEVNKAIAEVSIKVNAMITKCQDDSRPDGNNHYEFYNLVCVKEYMYKANIILIQLGLKKEY